METTAVTVYDDIQNPIDAIKSLGQTVAKSQLFGCQNEAQGEIIALQCMAEKSTPFSLAKKYDIFQGKLSMKADAMLMGFEEAGGEHEIKEYSPDACEIIFHRGKNNLPIRITWEDAKAEPWPYKQDGKTLKHNWDSPIARQDMLWARVVSRGVRRLAPVVVCGTYTPEEIQDFNPSPAIEGEVVQETPQKIKAPKIPASAKVGQSETKDQEAIEGEVVEYLPAVSEPESQEPEAAVVPDATGPVSEELVAKLKEQIGNAAQLGGEDITGKIVAKLQENKLAGLAGLNHLEAIELQDAIAKNNLQTWLDREIVGHGAPAPN